MACTDRRLCPGALTLPWVHRYFTRCAWILQSKYIIVDIRLIPLLESEGSQLVIKNSSYFPLNSTQIGNPKHTEHIDE